MTFLNNFMGWFGRGKASPISEVLPGHIPGFLGSPYHGIACIIEKWGPLRDAGNVQESPARLAEYFSSPNKNVLTTRERQLAASTVAWPPLMALNRLNITEGVLTDENQLLRDRVEELERQVAILRGKKPNPIIPVQKIRNISLEITGDPMQESPHELDSENESTKKSDLEAPLELDPFEIRPVVTQKTKETQDRPAGLPPDQWPPAQSTLRVTARPYTAAELMDLVQRFRQRPRESVPAWLLRLYDMGAESVVVNGPEISKLASITTHPALRQRLYAAVQHNEENHSLIAWLMAACRVTWANKTDIPLNTGLWSSMEDLQNYIRELGMKEAIYEDNFESPDMIKFSAGMRDLILQQAPPHQYGTLVSILNPLVASEAVIQQAAQLVADLGETERLRARRNVRMVVEKSDIRPPPRPRRPAPNVIQSGPIRVTRKQMFTDLIRAGVQFQKIYGQPNQVLLQLWKQLPNSQRFQRSPKREGVRLIERIPQNTWNLEDFIVPSKKRKPPQVARAATVEPSEEKDLGIAQLMA